VTQAPVTLCQTVHDLLTGATDGLYLNAHESALIDQHLAACGACRRDESVCARAPRPPWLQCRYRHQTRPARRICGELSLAWRRVRRWLTTPVPAYGAVAAVLVVLALVGAREEKPDSPSNMSLAAVADTILPSPVLTQADSYNVLANIRLIDHTLQAVPLLTDTLDRAVLPGTQL
jgi:hypothetical protein